MEGNGEAPGLRRAILAVALAGLAWRAWLALDLYPWLGDPTYAYAYRGMLIARGEMAGVFLTWHPPGYPLLLGALGRLSGEVFSCYTWGALLSLAASLGLILIIDRLLAPRTRWPLSRLVAASFLAFYEGVYLWAAGPLTEPVYLLLVYGAVAVGDRESVGFRRALVIGALLGLACSVRMEGLVAFAGVSLWLVAQAAWSRRPGWRSTALAVATGLGLGWLATFGWLLFHLDYLAWCSKEQESAFTFPPVRGVVPNLARAVGCAYHACTAWLPQVLLLPYWVLIPLGLLAAPKGGSGSARLQGLLLAVVLPSLIAVAWTIMHKRTGTFLLPAVAIWLALACEGLIARFDLHRRRGATVLVLGLVLFNLMLGVRYWVRRPSQAREQFPFVAGKLLRELQVEPGLLWAFGAQPEVYYFWDQTLVFPVLERFDLYDRHYEAHAGDPAGFIESLRGSGYRYLLFTLDRPARSGPSQTARQLYSLKEPLRGDLDALVRSPEQYRLKPLGTRMCAGGTQSIYLFSVAPG
jgi:hypothetical protein